MTLLPDGNVLELHETNKVLLCHDAAVPWGGERQIVWGIHVLSEALHRHRHARLHALTEIHPETQGNVHCLLPGALGWLGAETGENGAAPQQKSPCSCLSFMWNKQQRPYALPSQMLH